MAGPKHANLMQRINMFLSARRESKGGWAEITDNDVEALNKIVRGLIHAKCRPDPDGDVPIEFTIVDRRKFERMSFEPVPYEKEFHDEGTATIEEVIERCHFNMAIAFRRLDIMMQIKRDRDWERKKKKKATR